MRRFTLATTMVTVLALGAACSGGSEDPEADPTTGAASSSSSSESPSESPSEPAASESTGAVEPATGPRLVQPLATAQGPTGWEKADEILDISSGANDPDTTSVMGLGQIESYDDTLTADELADVAIAASSYPTPPKKLPVTELDGVEVYHLAGQVQKFTYLEEFGAVVKGKIVTLTFQFSRDYSPQERQEIVESVTATFRWT